MDQRWEEADWMIHWGCWHGLPRLDPKADISAISLVGPQTSKEEFRALYYEVYKIRRLPGSPSWELGQMEELATEIVPSLKDHLGQKGDEPLWRMEEPGLADVQPPRSKTPRRGRRDTSTERGLAEVREAHWRTLATVAILEEEIQWLSQSITQGQSETHAHSRSWDHWRRRSQGQNRRFCWVWLEESPTPFFKYSPSLKGPESGEDEEALLDFDLEALLELGPEVDHFLQESTGSSEEEDRKRSSPEPPVEDYESWVTWRAQVHDTPHQWQELAEVPGIDDHQKLAWEVWASFELPQQISEQHSVENYYQASPAAPCICQKRFLLSMTLSSPAGILGNCNWRRQLPMPKPSSFEQRKPICLLGANHAFWWRV